MSEETNFGLPFAVGLYVKEICQNPRRQKEDVRRWLTSELINGLGSKDFSFGNDLEGQGEKHSVNKPNLKCIANPFFAIFIS